MDDDEELSDEIAGDLGLCGSIRDALATSIGTLECSDDEWGEDAWGLFTVIVLEEDEMGGDFGSEDIFSPFLLLKMLS
jgi:hypothetical protein